jgi:Antitoxin VbhA
MNYAYLYAEVLISMATLTRPQVDLNLKAVAHAIAQQELEGLVVSEATAEDMRRAALGEIPSEEVLRNIYARFKRVPIFRP